MKKFYNDVHDIAPYICSSQAAVDWNSRESLEALVQRSGFWQ